MTVAKDIRNKPVRVLNKSNGEIIIINAGFDLNKLNTFVFEILEEEE